MERIVDKFPIVIEMLDQIEIACQLAVQEPFHTGTVGLKEMLNYHMGWENGSSSKRGKRIRPLLLCLCAHCAGGDWHKAMPAAVSVELVHNFSLIHDDIQDESSTRHGQPTLWKLVGTAQAINAGDALFSLALNHIWHLLPDYSAEMLAKCSQLLTETGLQLTEGQYLDLDFEKRERVTLLEYQSMISGKTTALIAGCTKMGAILAGADVKVQNSFHEYGRNLGFAFQVVDDHLGIWGDAAITGKSTTSDLVTGKMSYPVIMGLEKSLKFSEAWKRRPIHPEQLTEVIKLLEEVAIPEMEMEMADRYTHQAFTELNLAAGDHPDHVILEELSSWLLKRRN